MADGTTTVLAGIGLLALAVALGAQVALHLLPTGYQPVRDAVSDYGVGRYRAGYQGMCVALGGSAAVLAAGFAREAGVPPGRGLLWLTVFAVSRALIAGFPTDLPGAPRTAAGGLHVLLAVVMFGSFTAAASTLPGELGGAPGWHQRADVLHLIGTGVQATLIATAVALLVPAVRRRVFGLVERALYVAIFGWLAVAGIDLIVLHG